MRPGLLAVAIALALPAAGCSTLFPGPMDRLALAEGPALAVEPVLSVEEAPAPLPKDETPVPAPPVRGASGGVEPGAVLARSTRASAQWKRERPYDYDAAKARMDAVRRADRERRGVAPDATEVATRIPSRGPAVAFASSVPAQASAMAGRAPDADAAMVRIMGKADKVGGTICRGC